MNPTRQVERGQNDNEHSKLGETLQDAPQGIKDFLAKQVAQLAMENSHD